MKSADQSSIGDEYVVELVSVTINEHCLKRKPEGVVPKGRIMVMETNLKRSPLSHAK